MKSAEIWKNIHTERASLADLLATLTPQQWAQPSWCSSWSISQVAGHVLAAAEQTPLNFYRKLAAAGFKFNVFTDNDAKRLGALAPDEIVSRLRLRTSTTNGPPAPTIAMLGEIVVHSSDIRRPLGLDHVAPTAALVAVADSWKNSNLLIGSKRRITGVQLLATDTDWSHGTGPQVTGTLNSLILAMTGRKEVHSELSGEGVTVLADRP